MSPPPAAGTARLSAAANFELDRLRTALEGLGRDRTEELLAFHGFAGPLPYADVPTRSDTAHVALLLLRQHLPKDRR